MKYHFQYYIYKITFLALVFRTQTNPRKPYDLASMMYYSL